MVSKQLAALSKKGTGITLESEALFTPFLAKEKKKKDKTSKKSKPKPSLLSAVTSHAKKVSSSK